MIRVFISRFIHYWIQLDKGLPHCISYSVVYIGYCQQLPCCYHSNVLVTKMSAIAIVYAV